jgi:NTE family protein
VDAPATQPDGDSPPDPRGGLGLVLSGGGTRGIAHIGVLRALGEHGIAPERIAGASAGAIVGALYAAGYDPPAMLEFFVRKNPFRLSKVAITGPGIIDTEKVVADFEEYFPANDFAALDRDLRVVATDLVRGEPVVFDSGPLIPALLASSSMPVMFTPMEVGDRVLADGGIVDNFPVDLLAGRCRALLGVHVGPIGTRAREDLRSTLAVLRRALEVGMFHATESKYPACDLVLTPPDLARYGNLDTKHMVEVEQIGFDAAVARMDEIEAIAATAGSSR